MANIKEHIEIEDKYVLRDVPKGISWARSVLVYQFFYENEKADRFAQDKLVLNLTMGTVSFSTVIKEIIGPNKSNKRVEYKDIEELDLRSLLGRKFVMKRRHIKDNLFFDSYIYGAYPDGRDKLLMLEIEHDEDADMAEYADILDGAKCVSADSAYYNENMTITFTEEILEELMKLKELLTNNRK